MIHSLPDLCSSSFIITPERFGILPAPLPLRDKHVRLFAQPQTDDSLHDSTLSAWTATSNPLDLTLGHLDLVIEDDSKAEVEDVNVCSANGLTKLPPVRSMLPGQAALVKSDTEAGWDTISADAAATATVN
ncbi:hypothetical protein D9756_002788 [Leucocoprinus leucothites]|uniref:Uncharacterized protein n=1 Tax=Leucocoprinus leucothites TaxID=201217 RepID=A0A8H5GBH2_9AGAR|nr:hypothetical protein D9756_002788 [Leucoagaricus leucothites]